MRKILQLYSMVNPKKVYTQQVVHEMQDEVIGLPLISDAQQITLAEYNPITKDFITAHHLADYRRKQFELNLLPDVRTGFDFLLEVSNWH